MPSIAHFLLTRFNVPSEGWKVDRNQQTTLTSEWLEKRFALFETICFPSIANQNNKNFIWLVFFDKNTPDAYKARIQELQAKFGNMVPIFVNHVNELIDSAKENIEALSNGAMHIITSRIDNDDALSESAMDIIQSNAEFETDTIFDIVEGYQLIFRPDHMITTNASHRYNPFITLFSNKRNGAFRIVWENQHKQWVDKAAYKPYLESALWLQAVHDSNLVNKPNEKYLRLSDKEINKFHLSFALSYPKNYSIWIWYKNIFMLLKKIKRNLTNG